MYTIGRGVLNDKVGAHMWFNLAGANGSQSGSVNMVKIEKEMTSAQVAEAQRLARECMNKHYNGCGR